MFWSLIKYGGLGLIVVSAVYLVVTIVVSWAKTKSAPKVDMYLCNVHGPIPREGVISFLGADSCAICFHERLKKAERGLL